MIGDNLHNTPAAAFVPGVAQEARNLLLSDQLAAAAVVVIKVVVAVSRFALLASLVVIYVSCPGMSGPLASLLPLLSLLLWLLPWLIRGRRRSRAWTTRSVVLESAVFLIGAVCSVVVSSAAAGGCVGGCCRLGLGQGEDTTASSPAAAGRATAATAEVLLMILHREDPGLDTRDCEDEQQPRQKEAVRQQGGWWGR